ncbi:MAG TPA: serine/threonine-protein kinase [Kofleriaceae bacterium]|nr:serine/threonine-protein kinase [Kofleriaceae bacterium]
MSAVSPAPSVRLGGRYTLVRPLAVGGMAEIYLARQDAMAGFEKDVVIKRLKAEHNRDERLVSMFLDEARIGALLNHPNIVHVYDVGQDRSLPYIAMEYIRGQELNVLCRQGLALGAFLPLAHAVDLVRQAAAGMGYFHAATQGGHPIDIVHCDISPTNLLITEDGFLKIIDFGIARARNQSRLGPDAVPGKLSYMSPEQAQKRDLDHRSDIFSLGVVLYEITVGQRLFRGPAAEVIERLIHGEIPPPTYVNQAFPGALESIVMRALEREPADRYQSAYDLADDLEAFLHEHKLRSGPVRIARYLDSLAHAAGGQRRPELITEAEILASREDLELDREVFAGYFPAPAGAAGAPAWEEVDEGENKIADVLGIDVKRVRRGGRKATHELPVVALDDDAFGGDTQTETPVDIGGREQEVVTADYPRIADSELPPGAAADSVWQSRRRAKVAAKMAARTPRSAPAPVSPGPEPIPAAPSSAGRMALFGTVIVIVAAVVAIWLWSVL